MKNEIYSRFLLFCLTLSFAFAIDCPADTAYYVDMDTTSETYGDLIPTGLCACLGFGEALTATDSTITLTINVLDNEPLKGFQLWIYDNSNDALVMDPALGAGVTAGDKITGWNIPYTETFSGAAMVFGFSFSGNSTDPGTEGTLVEVTFAIVGELGETIDFWLVGEGEEAVRLSDTDAENVACSFPDDENPVTFDVPSMSVEGLASLPVEFSLKQNYPNPFNPVTNIQFDLPEQSLVKLSIYNLLGQEVVSLVNNQLNAGSHLIQWNGQDAQGVQVSTGLYIYSIQAGNFTDQKKMLMLQ